MIGLVLGFGVLDERAGKRQRESWICEIVGTMSEKVGLFAGFTCQHVRMMEYLKRSITNMVLTSKQHHNHNR